MTQNTHSPSAVAAPSWIAVLVVIGITLVVLLALFSQTVAGAVYQWNTSSAYNFGYLIAPIAGYLIWIQKDAIAVWRPAPSYLGLLLSAAFSAAWFGADVLGIDEGRQFALVGMMQGLFLTVLGWPLFRRIAFPLQYLWLQVPTGEFLLEPLQILSHAVAVQMLELSGMSVYAEGILIQVPSGNFLVEPGCAGLNFLLASIALALLYGKLTYRRWSTRLFCLALAIIMSILANFIRVYLIVAITEWSDRRINIADDHLFYGWVFFGIVMMIMMWWGMRFRDVFDDRPKPENERPASSPPHPVTREAAAAGLVLAICVAPIGYSALSASPRQVTEMAMTIPATIGDWRKIPAVPDWSPAVVAGDSADRARFARGSEAVDLSVTFYAAQVDGREAASGENGPVAANTWEITSQSNVSVTIDQTSRTVSAAQIQGPLGQRTVFSWYESSGCTTNSRLTAKLCAARDRILARPAPGAFIAISTPSDQGASVARGRLEDFTRNLRLAQILPNAVPAAAP